MTERELRPTRTTFVGRDVLAAAMRGVQPIDVERFRADLDAVATRGVEPRV